MFLQALKHEKFPISNFSVLDFRDQRCEIPSIALTTGGEVESSRNDILPYLKALILLQLEVLRDQRGDVKPEMLLHRAGIGIAEIAGMLGKTYPAVAKAISRAKSGAGKEQP